MSVWAAGALAVTFALVLCGIAIARAEIASQLAATQVAGALAAVDMMLLAQHFGNASMFDAALMVALLTPAGGLLYARFYGRWL